MSDTIHISITVPAAAVPGLFFFLIALLSWIRYKHTRRTTAIVMYYVALTCLLLCVLLAVIRAWNSAFP